MINGIPVHRLEEIELRLVGVDHRPWEITIPADVDHEGRRYVAKASRRAIKKANRIGVAEADRILRERGVKQTPEEISFDMESARKVVALFYRSSNATDDMLKFIAHAPKDVEDLLREIKQMHIIATKAKEERDQAVQELQSVKVAASRAEEKIVDMRRAWRTLCKEMGTKA